MAEEWRSKKRLISEALFYLECIFEYAIGKIAKSAAGSNDQYDDEWPNPAITLFVLAACNFGCFLILNRIILVSFVFVGIFADFVVLNKFATGAKWAFFDLGVVSNKW